MNEMEKRQKLVDYIGKGGLFVEMWWEGSGCFCRDTAYPPPWGLLFVIIS